MQRSYLEDEVTIDLRQVFAIIRKYLRIILVVPTLATLVAAVSVFFVLQPVYQAETTMLVMARGSTQTGQVVHSDLLASRLLVRTYREIARSRTVAQEVVTMLQIDLTAEELSEMVDVTLRGDTEIIAISVEDPNPWVAARVANAVAESFRSNVMRIMDAENVTVIDTATVPKTPVRPRKLLTTVVAGFAGTMVGFGLAFVLAYLDNTVKTVDDMRDKVGLPVLGTIPLFKNEDFAKERAGV